MRLWVLLALLPCALPAQSAPPGPGDGDVFHRLQQRLDWFQPAAHPPEGAWKARVDRPAGKALPAGGVVLFTASGVCSIPLLRVPVDEGFVDPMSMAMPPRSAIDPKFALPAPPVCEAWKP